MTRFALMGLLFTAIPTAAIADPSAATITVTTADMATPAARARLDRRIGAAIEQVCGSYAAIESSQVPEMDECWNAAKSEVQLRLASFDVKARIELSAR